MCAFDLTQKPFDGHPDFKKVELLEQYDKIRHEHDLILGKLTKEVERIIDAIFAGFNKRLGSGDWWAYEYYEGDCGQLPLPLPEFRGKLPIYISRPLKTSQWEYNEGIPLKFFNMSSEDIAKYIKKEIETDREVAKRLKEHELSQKSKKKLEQERLRKSALSKLTDAERAALKL